MRPPPSRPGTEAVLRRLELTVTRRLDGLLQGDHAGLRPGPGSEAGEARVYVPGDDVRRMDWNVTARTGAPHVRLPIADHELETWVVVDRSPSLDFGTAACEKRDLALSAVAAVGHLTARAGNRMGAVLVGAEGTTRVPARSGRLALQALLHTVASTPRADGGGATDLAPALTEVARLARRRSLVVVVSDFLGVDSPTGWAGGLRVLTTRHDVLAVEVVDPRELELPDVGVLALVDPETGGRLEVATSNRRLRARYAEAAAAQRAEVAATFRSAGADHLVLRTDADWLADVVRFVQRRRRALRPPAPRPVVGP
jgi:uncharacterized protein (DUF58 family)